MSLFLLFLLLFILFCGYGYYAVTTSKEKTLLHSPLYIQSVAEWKGIQEWCKNNKNKKVFKNFTILLDKDGLCGYELNIDFNEDGIPTMPNDLSASQFILAVQKIRKELKIDEEV